MIEDAISGVEAVAAAASASSSLWISADRDALVAHGADVVVADLGELAVADLDAQLRRKRELVVAWRIEQEGFDPAREHAMESLFTVGNGDLGVRGAFDQLPPGSQGDLFIAGIYDRKHPERPYSEVDFIGEGRENYPYS